jgi:CheY-like chemotaxis protein/anti-sigma regulatory factor (Ser/Thr protein kinase)
MALNEIRHRGRLQRDYQPGLPPAQTNEARLGQVVLNLLVNAAHAMPEASDREKVITLATRTEGGRIVIEVTDTGTGIARENLARLFDPFFTTKPVGVGTGLGLYICQQALASMDGSITVESELGRGSTFCVSLPAASEPIAHEPEHAPEVAATRRARILAIDDEPQIGRVLQHTLKGHDVSVADSAYAALDRLRSGERFDLIFCDLMMPGMTGMELHATLAKELPEQARRMVFLTGGAFTARASEFLETIDEPHVEKPFEVRAMRALVAERLALLGFA